MIHIIELGYVVEKKQVGGDSVPVILMIQTFSQNGNPMGAIAESLARLSSVSVLIVKEARYCGSVHVVF